MWISVNYFQQNFIFLFRSISIEDYKLSSNLDAYLMLEVVKDVNSSDSYTFSTTIKTDVDFSPSSWDALDFNLNSKY